MKEAQAGSKHWNWQGGIAGNREHVLSENQCIKLNKRFLDSNFHHLSQSIGIYIPRELHQHIMPHSLISGIGMIEINILALQYLNGEYFGITCEEQLIQNLQNAFDVKHKR